MKLIAKKNASPDFDFPFYYGMASRKVTETLWWNSQQRAQREWEDTRLADLSSAKSPLHRILKAVKTSYVEMNQTVAE